MQNETNFSALCISRVWEFLRVLSCKDKKADCKINYAEIFNKLQLHFAVVNNVPKQKYLLNCLRRKLGLTCTKTELNIAFESAKKPCTRHVATVRNPSLSAPHNCLCRALCCGIARKAGCSSVEARTFPTKIHVGFRLSSS